MTQVFTDLPGLEETEDTNTFITRNTSRYDSYYFYGVVINTGISKYLTAGYGQF
jgi:hypothetical protein